jgi:molybdate transport repressor ModE-like protein
MIAPAEAERWLGIQARHLTALAAVARTGSIAAAASELGYVASAVSTQITQLERVVGTPLLMRPAGVRGSTLTAAGTVMLDHAHAILATLAAARDELDDVPEPALGVARLFDGRVDPLLAALTRDDGVVGLGRLERGSGAELLARLRSGALDAAVVELPIAAGPFAAAELRREPMVLAAPAAAPAEAGAALAHHPLVAVDDCRASARLALTAASRHRAPTPAHALELVRAGLGCAAVAAGDAADARGLTLLAMPDLPPRTTGIAWQAARDGEPAITALARVARTALHALG